MTFIRSHTLSILQFSGFRASMFFFPSQRWYELKSFSTFLFLSILQWKPRGYFPFVDQVYESEES